MPYALIVVLASIALVAYFVFVTEASWITKAVVSGIFIFCMASRFGWIACSPLVSQFLLIALNVFILVYRTWEQAKTGQ
jgi:hypothetical protein